MFCLFDLILYVPSTFFQLCRDGFFFVFVALRPKSTAMVIAGHVGMDLPGLNQYLARINVSCSRTQCSDTGEAQTCGPLVLPLSHCAPTIIMG